MIANELSIKLDTDRIQLINVSKLNIFSCEGNVSSNLHIFGDFIKDFDFVETLKESTYSFIMSIKEWSRK